MFYVVDSILSNLEETFTRRLLPTPEVTRSIETSSEPDMSTQENTYMSEVAMKQVLLLVFDDLCSLQEHSVLACLMFGMANQMASRLVLTLQSFVCISCC